MLLSRCVCEGGATPFFLFHFFYIKQNRTIVEGIIVFVFLCFIPPHPFFFFLFWAYQKILFFFFFFFFFLKYLSWCCSVERELCQRS